MCKCDHWYQYEYLYSVHVCLPGMLTCTGASKVTARVHESKQTSASVYIYVWAILCIRPHLCVLLLSSLDLNAIIKQ
jgi:hypothetical protein